MGRSRKNKKQTNLDVAILTCGLVEPQVFDSCILSVMREAGGIANIYIYINGAPKDATFVKETLGRYPEIKIKQTTERVGFPAGANRTIRSGSSPYFLFVTDDIILHEGSVSRLLERMESDKKIAICGMKLIFPEDSQSPERPAGRVQHIGHSVDIRGEITHPLMGWKPENPKCNISREVLSVTGGVFMARRDAFIRAGGFFEGYGLGYFEDVDLCLSVRQLEYTVWIETTATATHYTNMSMMKSEVRPNLNFSKMIFMQRNSNKLVNDSWTFW